jgi:hypothetical protein
VEASIGKTRIAVDIGFRSNSNSVLKIGPLVVTSKLKMPSKTPTDSRYPASRLVTSFGVRFVIALMVLVSGSALCKARLIEQAGVDVPGSEPCGMFSNLVVPTLPSPNRHKTAIRIMASRDKDLSEAVEGYARTGIALVGYNNETGFVPAGLSDDPGIYYFIPMISRRLHLDLAKGISVFFMTALVVPLVLGGWGLMLVLRSGPSRAIGLTVLCILSCLAYRIGDVYIFEFAVPLALIPWVVRFTRKRHANWVTAVAFLGIGAAIGVGASVRSAAAIPACVFFIILLATHPKIAVSRTIGFAALALTGLLGPLIFFHRIAQARDSFLLNQAGVQRADLSRHITWHLAYIGMGFLSNPYVPGGVCDEVGKQKVRAVAPEVVYLSEQYDRVLRSEVLSVVSTHPLLTLLTLAAKLGIVLVVVAIFANVGLLAAFLRPKPWGTEVAFWAALGASAVPVLLVAPATQYLVGVVSLAGLYGIFSIDHAIQPIRSWVAKSTGLASNCRLEVGELREPDDQLVAPWPS